MSGGYGYGVRSYNNTVAPPVAEKRKKVMYTESDHVARQQPYVPSTETYVVKSERIIEKVLPPPTVIEYSTVTTPVKYGVEGNRWETRLSTPVDDCPRKVADLVTQVETKVATQPHLLRPVRLSPEYARPQETDRWSRSSSPISPPVADYGGQTNTWESRTRPSSHVGVTPVTDHYHNSNAFPKIHTTENNPWLRNSPQPSLIKSANWPQTPNSSYTTIQRPQSGYESYNDYDETPKDYVAEQYKYISTERPSPQLARNTWTRPSTGGSWGTTTTKITTLAKPTNDINEAVNYLAGALQQSSLTHDSPRQQYYDTLGYPKMGHYEDTIDSRESQSRYGNFNESSMAMESYVPTIDSREALRKYGGAAV